MGTQRYYKRKSNPRCSPEEAKYYKLWGIYCDKFDRNKNDREHRHECTRLALGYDKSHKEWTHTEFDIMYSALICWTNGYEFDRDQYINAGFSGAARRKIFRILEEAPHAYVQNIAKSKFGCSDWHNLSLQQLEQLRITVIERARSHRRRHGKNSSLYQPKKAQKQFTKPF